MINYTFRSLGGWLVARCEDRRKGPFVASYTVTMKLLESELSHSGAENIIIQAEIDPSQLRNDGLPRSDARFRGPGIILSYTRSDKKTYVFPCDTFTHWQDNLRAIALTFEHLRAIDRYGVTRGDQQYAGFRQLSAADPKAERSAALTTLEKLSGCDLGTNPSEFDIELAYRAAAKCTHPDRGGSSEVKDALWVQLQTAMSVLRPKKVIALSECRNV